MVCSAEKNYLKEVEKNLTLPRPLRRKLLSGLQRELSENSNQANCLEPPAEIASLLMEQVPIEVRTAYQKRRKQRISRIIAVFLLLFLMLLFFTGYLLRLKKSQVVRAESEIVVIDIVDE